MSRPIAILLVANVISIAGNRLTALAIPWYVLQTTGSVGQTGLVGFFALLPFVVSSALGGVVVDRLGRRRASVVADVASGASVLAIPVCAATVGLPLALLLGLVFVGALLDAPGQTAREAMLPQLIARAGAETERVVALFDGASRAAGMVGAILGGVLIAALGPAEALYVDAASFACSALLVRLGVPEIPVEGTHETRGYAHELREGFAYLVRTPIIRAMVVLVLVTNMLDAGMAGVLMPVYADTVLDSVVALGLMGALFGVGAVLGTLLFAWCGSRLPRVTTLVAGFTLGGPSRYFLLAAVPGLGPILVGSVIAGVGIGPVNPILGTIEYERVPPRLLARVLGAVSAGVLAAAPFGALLAAGAVSAVGLEATLVTFGVVYLACTLSPLVVPAWRDAERPLAADVA